MAVREVPASFGQRLLWMMDRQRSADGDLNERLAWRLHGPLDTGALQAALDDLVERHEILRTTVVGSTRSLTQVVHEPHPVAIQACDVPATLPDEALAEVVADAAERRIDPAREPLRAQLWRVRDGDHLLLLALHHLATDPRSNAILARDLGALYSDRVAGRRSALPAPQWQYADWSLWQRRRLEGSSLYDLQRFWREELAGTHFVALPESADATRRGAKGYERRALGRDAAEGMRELARELGCTPFAVALAAFWVQLRRLTRRSDLAVASLFANRGRPEVRHTAGFFVNMLVLRAPRGAHAAFADLARATQAGIDRATAHQELPFQMLPPDVVSRRSDAGLHRADDVVFQFVDGEPRATALAELRGLQATPIERQGRGSRFALELFVALLPHTVAPVLVYDSTRVDRAYAVALADGYAEALHELVLRPRTRAAVVSANA